MIPESSATAEATPILWASKSTASGLLEFSPRGVGTSCSTTEPVIRLTTAKVPEMRQAHTGSTSEEDTEMLKRMINVRLCVQKACGWIWEDHITQYLLYTVLTLQWNEYTIVYCKTMVVWLEMGLTSRDMSTCAKQHIEDHRKEGSVKAIYWCHRCE